MLGLYWQDPAVLLAEPLCAISCVFVLLVYITVCILCIIQILFCFRLVAASILLFL